MNGAIFISPENEKMGPIPSLSFPRALTCNKRAPCYRSKRCYMAALERWRPWLIHKSTPNLTAYRQDPTTFFQQLRDFCTHTLPGRFRYFVAGDAPDRQFWTHAAGLAEACPRTLFMAYTKKYAFLPTPRPPAWPDNFKIRVSAWPGLSLPQALRDSYPVSWYDNPKVPDRRIPRTAPACPGDCQTCTLCYTTDSDTIHHDTKTRRARQ